MTFKKLFVCVLLVLVLLACNPGSAPVPTETPIPSPTIIPTVVPGMLYVDPDISLGEISPLVYGSNHGPWTAVPVNLLEAAINSKVTVVRFPGGEWGDRNKTQTYHIDFFMSLVEQMGAEASISVRLPDSTPEEAAELVRYVNIEKGYNVRFWSIGNEPTLYAPRDGEEYDTEWYNPEWRAFAEAMRTVDPDILLVGPDVHQFTPNPDSNPKDPQGRDWMTEFLKANGDMVDIVSFHRYPFPASMSSPPASIEELRANTQEWDAIIAYLRELILETTGREIPISIGEVNSHYTKAVGGEGTPDSHYNAIWWADVLGRLIQQDVYMVNHWLLSTSANQGGWGLINRGALSPSYHVYQLYDNFGEELIYASSDDPDLRVYAAKREDGALTLIVLNLADQEISKPITVAGKSLGPAEHWLLDVENSAENKGSVDLSLGAFRFPPQSFSLFIIP